MFLKLGIADHAQVASKDCKRIVTMLNEHEDYEIKMEAQRVQNTTDLEVAQDAMIALKNETQVRYQKLKDVYVESTNH